MPSLPLLDEPLPCLGDLSPREQHKVPDIRGRRGGTEGLLTVPGLKLKLMSRRIWATRTAKDKLAWMW